MEYRKLFSAIQRKTAKVGIIGLGYVGLPLALELAQKGFFVTGFARDKDKIEKLNRGESILSDIVSDAQVIGAVKKHRFHAMQFLPDTIATQDVLIICVPTPINKRKLPDISAFEDVAKTLASINLDGKLIINESTVAPGMTRQILGSLRGSYFLACSPERVDPGNKEKTVVQIAKVVGGKDSESQQLAKALYEKVLSSSVVAVSSLEAAEMAKMLENTYRAVNIALINEFARMSDALNLDILEIIEAAKTKWSFHAHFPSLGVGGHCIPVDPYYLLEEARKKHVNMAVVRDGLRTNEEMTEYFFQKIHASHKKGMSVVLYGISYKKDVKDVRESPVLELCNKLKRAGISFGVYDPFFTTKECKKFGLQPAESEFVDIFIVGTDHTRLGNDYKRFVNPTTVVFDGRNYFRTRVGKIVHGIGRELV